MRALVGFADPIRPGIADAMAMARGAGIQVVVVTGDHPRTAATIAREAGLDADTIVTGEQVASWDDEQLAAELGDLHVVARSTPEQKLRLVRAARADGTDRGRHRRRRERRAGAPRRRRRGRDGLRHGGRARGVGPRRSATTRSRR